MFEQPNEKMAYFRYNVISPLLSDDGRLRKVRIQELAKNCWTLPCGRVRQFSYKTISDWFYNYSKHGFESLVTSPRSDRGEHRCIPDEVCEQIDVFIKQYPNMKNSNIIRLLDEKSLLDHGPSQSSLYRYLKRIRPAFEPSPAQRRAFEAGHAGDLYQTDIMYGPKLPLLCPDGRYRGQDTYLVAIIDDYSRLICHAEFFVSQNIMSYIHTLKQAISKYGIANRIYCDNGQVFLSPQIKRIAAQIGTRIIHTKIRDAAAKGKIQRWFLTVRNRFLNGILPQKKVKTIQELNDLFNIFVSDYNNTVHSSIDSTPLERWLQSPQIPRHLKEDIHSVDLFMLEIERKVKKDGTFSVKNILFETNYAYVGKKVRIRYNSQELSKVYVYCGKDFLGVSFPLNRQGNNHVPRQQ